MRLLVSLHVNVSWVREKATAWTNSWSHSNWLWTNTTKSIFKWRPELLLYRAVDIEAYRLYRAAR